MISFVDPADHCFDITIAPDPDDITAKMISKMANRSAGNDITFLIH